MEITSLAQLQQFGEDPPTGTTVVCPSRLPGLPEYADPRTAYGEWSTPCEVQKVVQQPPEPYAGCPPDGCLVLPDSTPLYEYTADGSTQSQLDPGPVQTYFAGVPLDYPPVRADGGPNYSLVSKGPTSWPKGIASTYWDASPAPFAWESGRAPGYLGINSQNVAQAYADMSQIPPQQVWSPLTQFPPPVQTDNSLWGVINDIGSYACNAIGVGLAVSGPAVKAVTAGTPGLSKAHQLGQQYFTKICGSN